MEDMPIDIEELGAKPVGDYVNDLPYLKMRLRMALTGTACKSSKKAWAKALQRLLAHLAEHPLPKVDDGHQEPLEWDDGTPIPLPVDPEARPISDGGVTPVTEDQITHALEEIATLDIGDWSQIVMASEHPVAAIFTNQSIRGIELGANHMTKLSEAADEEYHFAIDVSLGLNDHHVRLTLIGVRIGEEYDWRSAEPTLVDPRTCIVIQDMVKDQIPDLSGGDVWKLLDEDLIKQIERRADDTLPDGAEHLHQVGLHHLALRMDVERIVITGTAQNAECIVRSWVVLTGGIETPCLLRCRASVGSTPYLIAVSLSEM